MTSRWLPIVVMTLAFRGAIHAAEPSTSVTAHQDLLLLSPLEPLRVRLVIEINGVPFRKTWSDTIARQFDTVFRTVMRGPAVTSGREFFRYITNEPHPFGNFAIVSDPSRVDHAKSAIDGLLPLKAPSAVIFPGAPVESLSEGATESAFVVALRRRDATFDAGTANRLLIDNGALSLSVKEIAR